MQLQKSRAACSLLFAASARECQSAGKTAALTGKAGLTMQAAAYNAHRPADKVYEPKCAHVHVCMPTKQMTTC